MTIRKALESQGWRLQDTETGKWIAVKDDRIEFRNAFSTDRVGKLLGSKFFVTLADLDATARCLILETGQDVEPIVSTSGRGAVYPGFECAPVPADVLFRFADELRREVDARL